MKGNISLRKTLLSLLAMLLMSTTPAFAGDVPALENAIKAWTRASTVPTYKIAFVDLNDDGIDDAVVLITGNEYCGSGGCSLVVFEGVAGRFKFVSSSTITREPILLLAEKNKGWHTLSVLVAGGGVTPGQVVMQFNGRKYPSNPSTQRKAKKAELEGAKILIGQGRAQSFRTSFDCANARSEIEKSICGVKELAEADVELSAIYNSLQSNLPASEKIQLKRDQLDWLKNRNATCSKSVNIADCIQSFYINRIDALRNRH